MRKSIALVALAFGVTSAFAQDLTSKKGEPILPEAGDWGIGIDANPFLNYAGNFFGKTNNNVAPGFNFFTQNQTITGRYFLDATHAVRGSFNIGFNSNTINQPVAQLPSNPTNTVFPNPTNIVQNSWKNGGTTIGIGAGYEIRKGKTRLQGYYGGDVGFMVTTNSDKFTYGNALVASTTPSMVVTPSSADNFTGTNNGYAANNVLASTPLIQNNGANVDARITSRNNGTSFMFGVRGFVGAEYFILPKMSIGGEFGWGIGFQHVGAQSMTLESVGNNSSGNLVTGSTTIDAKNATNNFMLGTDNKNSIFNGLSGQLRFNMYF